METLYEDQYTNQLLDFIIEGFENSDNFDKIVTDADEIFKTIDNKSDGTDVFKFKLSDEPKKSKTIKVNVSSSDDDEAISDTNIKDSDDSVDQEANDIFQKSNPANSKSKSFKVNVLSKEDQEEDKKEFRFKLRDDREDPDAIRIKLRKKEDDPHRIVFKLEKPSNKKANQMNIKVRPMTEIEKVNKIREEIVNKLANNTELKEMLKNDNASSILGTCLQILRTTKTTVEKLTVLLPDDVILLKTHHIIGQLIDRIIDNQDEITDNLDQCKQLAIQIVKMSMDLKSYLKVKANDIASQINNTENRDAELEDKMEEKEEDIKKLNRETKENKKEPTFKNAPVPSQKMSGE